MKNEPRKIVLQWNLIGKITTIFNEMNLTAGISNGID